MFVLRDIFIPTQKNGYKAYLLHLPVLFTIVVLTVTANILWFLPYLKNTHVKGLQTDLTEETIISLTNERRVNAGLNEVSQNPILSQAARLKAESMVKANVFEHYYEDENANLIDPWQFILDSGYDYFYAGENLGKDFTKSSTLVQAWYDSPTHRDNLLNPRYQEIGIAIVEGPFLDKEETTLIVQLFATTTEAVIASGELDSETSQKGDISSAPLLEQDESWVKIIVKEYPSLLFSGTLMITVLLGLTMILDLEVRKKRAKKDDISIDLWHN